MHGLVGAEGTNGDPNTLGDKNAQGQYTAAGIGQWSNQVNGKIQPISAGEVPADFAADAQSLGLNPEDFSIGNQNKVLYGTLAKDKAAGLTPQQSLSKWNSGNPNAYEDAATSTGTGPVGNYNVSAYVQKAMSAASTYAASQRQTPLQQANVPAPQLSGPGTFLGDVGNTLSQSGTQLSQAIGQTASGQINPLSGLIQSGSAIASGATGLLNDALSDTPVVGSVYKGLTGLIGQGVGAAANTQTGQGLIADWQNFAQAHPEASADVAGVANIASTLAGGDVGAIGKDAIEEGVYNAAKEGTLGAGVKGIIDKGATSDAAEILGSAPTKAEVKSAVRSGRLTTKGGVPGIEADAAKQNSVNQVANLIKEGKVSKTALVGDNAIAIKNAADETAQQMRTELRSQEIQKILQPEELQSFEDNVIKKAGTSATSGENPARTLLNVFKEALPEGKDVTSEDVLNARQAVSDFVLANKGDWSTRGVLTGFKSARNAFWAESRKMLVDMAPGVDVDGLLQKQTGLYKALEDIVPNVKKQLGSTRLSRAAARHPLISGLVKAGGKAALEGSGVGAALKMFQ